MPTKGFERMHSDTAEMRSLEALDRDDLEPCVDLDALGTARAASRPAPVLAHPALATLALSATLCRIGSLEVKLATTKREIRRAQRLRYQIFFEEGAAVPDRTAAIIRRDVCEFDSICDHLLVIDHAGRGRFGQRKPRVVGTYRLLRQEIAARHFGFYTEREFDIAPLLRRHAGKNFLELGRSCVLAEYRSKRTVELLWRGIWAYVRHYNIDVMIGCASLAGADPERHRAALGYLQRHAGASDEWRATSLPQHYVSMHSQQESAINTRAALSGLPALLKGYLRLGARVGDGAVVDERFGTTDVFVVLPVADIDPRYKAHFSVDPDLERDAA